MQPLVTVPIPPEAGSSSPFPNPPCQAPSVIVRFKWKAPSRSIFPGPQGSSSPVESPACNWQMLSLLAIGRCCLILLVTWEHTLSPYSIKSFQGAESLSDQPLCSRPRLHTVGAQKVLHTWPWRKPITCHIWVTELGHKQVGVCVRTLLCCEQQHRQTVKTEE